MHLLYQLLMTFLSVAIHIASIWNKKLRKGIAGRKDWQKKLKANSPTNGFDLWMHCSSLGEFEQGRPVIEAYRKKFPTKKILLTFFSPSGYDMRKNFDAVDFVSYLPFDTKSNANQFINIVKPKLAIFVKYDFWPNLMKAMLAKKTNAFLIAAQFHNEDQFHKWYGRWTLPYLKVFNKIFLQEGPEWKALKDQHQIIAGDPRVDRVIDIQRDGQLPQDFEDWKKNNVFVWGSVWKKDWPLMLQIIGQDLSDWQHIIAPHDIEPNEIEELQSLLAQESDKFTDQKLSSKIVILNTIGHLSQVYRIADLAYIGGGFGAGIHNILEPLAAAVPVFFGPKHQKFPEAQATIATGCGFQVESRQEFSTLLNIYKTEAALPRAQELAGAFIQSRSGATAIIMEEIA